jgi:hypothetical protein
LETEAIMKISWWVAMQDYLNCADEMQLLNNPLCVYI